MFKPAFTNEQFKYKVINVYDMPFVNLSKHFQECIDFIKDALDNGGAVLVHCFAGVSRSATIILAYLMQERGMSFLDAMSFVKRRRPIIFPNFGF